MKASNGLLERVQVDREAVGEQLVEPQVLGRQRAEFPGDPQDLRHVLRLDDRLSRAQQVLDDLRERL